VNSPQSLTVYIPEEYKGEIIGRQGENIKKREEKLWCSISVKTQEQDNSNRSSHISWKKKTKTSRRRR